jgi:4-phospho-D-threonate 3-dehydrogenase / 4-phospho-D-erythronate 3-dehydrogenase
VKRTESRRLQLPRRPESATLARMPRPPLIALTLGDPAGIGPEISLRALRERSVRRAARLVVIGPAELRPLDVPVGTPRRDLADGEAVWVPLEGLAPWRPAETQRAGGEAALAALRIGHQLALEGEVDALVTAPVSKEALHLAGEEVEGQTGLLGKWCGIDDHQMLAVAGKLRVLLLTRHLPLKKALQELSEERVVDHLHLLHRGLENLGFQAPKLALAGLNPHASERGLFGSEEREILEPAAWRARGEGIDVTGPISPDVVFADAAKGIFDGVLALYHDQAFIPIKLLGEGCGFTVIFGLPYLRMSPAHGVAFDLVGTGRARHEDLVTTILQAAEWGARFPLNSRGASPSPPATIG